MKFNKLTRTAVLSAMQGGAGRDRAARIAGLDPKTLRAWVLRGDQDGSGDYADFAREVHRIDAARLQKAERTIWDAIGGGDVKAAQWMLEKRCPQDYGAKVTEQSDDEIEAAPLDPASRELVTAALRAIRSQRKPAEA